MRATSAAPVLALVLAALAPLPAAPLAAAQDPGEGGAFLAVPLSVTISSPPDGTLTAHANLTAAITAEGESVGFHLDAFANGTLVNVTLDAGGLSPNASAGASYYESPPFELPSNASGFEWSPDLVVITSGSSANLTPLLGIDVRLGGGLPGGNWTAWLPATVDGDFSGSLPPGNDSLLASPAVEYRLRFLDPANATNPHVTQVEVWYLAHIVRVEARSAPGGDWSLLGTSEGDYNFSLTLAPGLTVIEARATDASGATAFAAANVTLDLTAPDIASAPPNGTSVPPDTAAEIRFTEPIDQASASVHVTVDAPFPVDLVWTADNTTLLVSAQQSGRRGPVTLTFGPHLRDRVGNEFGRTASFTYEMGKPAESAPSDVTLILAVMFAAVAAAGGVVMLHMAGLKRKRQAYAEEIRRSLDQGGGRPPGGP